MLSHVTMNEELYLEEACKKKYIHFTDNIWVGCYERRHLYSLRNNCLLNTKVRRVKVMCWQVCQWTERCQLLEVFNRMLYDWQTEDKKCFTSFKTDLLKNYKKSIKYLTKKKPLCWNKQNVLTSTKWKFILKTEQVMEWRTDTKVSIHVITPLLNTY
jgi:hypothetical protein